MTDKGPGSHTQSLHNFSTSSMQKNFSGGLLAGLPWVIHIMYCPRTRTPAKSSTFIPTRSSWSISCRYWDLNVLKWSGRDCKKVALSSDIWYSPVTHCYIVTHGITPAPLPHFISICSNYLFTLNSISSVALGSGANFTTALVTSIIQVFTLISVFA